MTEYILAKNIHECTDCPLYESECNGGTTDGAGNFLEPPCCAWQDDDEIYDGMIEDAWLARERSEEAAQKALRKLRARRATETRKKYEHLNEKYAAFSKWLSQSSWNLLITSRRKDCVYMRALGKKRANYCFNLEKEMFLVISGKISLGDKTIMNRFENDFKEFYHGRRPKDRDFVAERINEMKGVLKAMF